MDLKFRFEQANNNPQRGTGLDAFRTSNNSQRPSLNQRPNQSQGGGALNRFRKKTEAGKAPEGQFKKYML